jgi:hypothetical protein
MATQTLASADAILKDKYVGPIVEVLNNKTWLLDKIKRESQYIDHTGRRVIRPLHTKRNRGRGSTSSAGGGTLPTAGKQGWSDAIITMRRHFYGIEIDDAVKEASKSNEGAFVNVLTAETQGVATDMNVDMNRQMYGEGTGNLGSVTANQNIGDTTVVLDSVQYVHVDDPIDVRKRSDGTVGVAGAFVTDVNVATKTVTFTPALTGNIDNTFGVYIKGNRLNETDGLRNMIATNRTLHGIDSSVAAGRFFNATEKTAGGNIAGEDLFEQLDDDTSTRGNSSIDVFLTTKGIRRRLANQYTSQKRYNDAKAVDIHGGYSAIFVNETPVVPDDQCPKGFVFGLANGAFEWHEQTKPGWFEDPEGKIWHLKPANPGPGFEATWEAWFRWYATPACHAPGQTGRIIACQDDDPVSIEA